MNKRFFSCVTTPNLIMATAMTSMHRPGLSSSCGPRTIRNAANSGRMRCPQLRWRPHMWDVVSLQLIFNGGARSNLHLQKQKIECPLSSTFDSAEALSQYVSHTHEKDLASMYHTHLQLPRLFYKDFCRVMRVMPPMIGD